VFEAIIEVPTSDEPPPVIDTGPVGGASPPFVGSRGAGVRRVDIVVSGADGIDEALDITSSIRTL
jgi:hypothetical protein